MTTSEDKPRVCGLCGTSFAQGKRSCAGCPLGSHCDLTCCPNCGHGMPRRSFLVEWLRRLGRRLESNP